MNQQVKWVGIPKMFSAVEFLRKKVYKELPIQQMSILLLVAQNEGITMRELENELSNRSISKNLKELGRYVKVNPDESEEIKGHDLLYTAQNEYNRRQFSVYVTPKGKKIMAELERLLN